MGTVISLADAFDQLAEQKATASPKAGASVTKVPAASEPTPAQAPTKKRKSGSAAVERLKEEPSPLPEFKLDMSDAFVLRHDPEYPQWKNPVVWQGESERQIRALCAQFGVERVPYSLEELIAMLAYMKQMHSQLHRLHAYYSPDLHEGWIESTFEVMCTYFPQWAPGIKAYMQQDKDALRAMHRGDSIYERLINAIKPAELQAEANKILAIVFPEDFSAKE